METTSTVSVAADTAASSAYIAQLEAQIRTLQQAKHELEQTRAAEAVLTQYADLVQWDVREQPEAWGDRMAAALAQTFGAPNVVLYRMDATAETPCLRLLGGYALPTGTPTVLQLGEGLTGQAALDRQEIHLNDFQVSRQVSSGQHTLPLQCLHIHPLLYNDAVQGVLEMASANPLTHAQRLLMAKLHNMLAASLGTLNSQLHLRQFYEDANKHKAALHDREAILQRKIEEFEHLRTQHNDLLSTAQALQDAADAFLLRAELTPDGHFFSANAGLCKLLGYEWYEIKGCHHSLVVTKDMAESESNRRFWEALADGQPMEGEFQRLTRQGEVVWMRAVYRPIMSEDGKLLRILKLAEDATDTRRMAELLAEQRYETEQLRQKLVEALRHQHHLHPGHDTAEHPS